MTFENGRASALLALTLTAAAGSAGADDGSRVPLLPAYVQECGSCHVAFPPGLLPAASWQRLLAGLTGHFGSDASMDAAVTKSLSDWLSASAGSGRRAAGAPKDDRLTQGAWFQREHRQVQALFGSAKVKGAADCAACHTRAAEGSFHEREIRIPKRGPA
jgi:mono/diheme cytochrome c family protein